MNSPTDRRTNIVQITNLSRQFDQQLALDNISIEVKPGQIFGIIGENGAGKTTLIKHILGQYKAQQGSVEVFDENPVEQPKKVLAEIGYLSEEPELPAWMSINELLSYTSAFYPTWDDDYANELVTQFGLEKHKRVRELSKGQKARIGLVLAQAHRPKLLLLDEPSSGLDPNVRRDILSAAIKTVSSEGRTVIFSSHLLDEVERVCDHLMMIDKGRVLLFDSMENIITNHQRFIISDRFLDDNSSVKKESLLLAISGVFNVEEKEHEWQVDFYGSCEQIENEFREKNMAVLSKRVLSLNDIFISRTRSTVIGD